jgi:hypothetical protein
MFKMLFLSIAIDLTFDDRPQKPTAKINPASWIERPQDVRELLFYRV